MSTRPLVIHVRLFRRRYWEIFERKRIEPFYGEKAQAVYYARNVEGWETRRCEFTMSRAGPAEEQMLYAQYGGACLRAVDFRP